MEYRFVELEGYDAIGLRTECPGGDTGSIGPLWDRLFHDASAQFEGGSGVVGLSWGDGADGFSYLAAHKVPAGRGAELAQQHGLESYSVPGGRYVSVQWQGPPEEMKTMFQDIFRRILPENGLALHPEGACIEDYPPDAHDPVAGTLKCELLVRVV